MFPHGRSESSETDEPPKRTSPISWDFDGLLSSAKQKEVRTSLMQSASHVTENSPLDDWLPYAACRGKIDLFFRHTCTPRCNVVGCQRLSSVKACRAICAACPVLIQCRKWSVAKVPVGFTGGLTESERAQLAALLGVQQDFGSQL